MPTLRLEDASHLEELMKFRELLPKLEREVKLATKLIAKAIVPQERIIKVGTRTYKVRRRPTNDSARR